MATNGDLKRWYGDEPTAKVEHDFVRYDGNGSVPHTTAKLYKHNLKFTDSGKTYHFSILSTASTKFTTAGDIPWASSLLLAGTADGDTSTDGAVIGAIALADGSRKLIGAFNNAGVITNSVVALVGTVTDAEPILIN